MAEARDERRLLAVACKRSVRLVGLCRTTRKVPPTDAPAMVCSLVSLPHPCARAPPHTYLITWSAWNRSAGGMGRPSALAALRLMTNTNFTGCSTGKSAGIAPFRILSA